MANEDAQKPIEPPTPKKAKAPVPMAPSIADVEPELEPVDIEPENGDIPEDPTQNDPE